jgi:hypothetical protein
VNIYYRPLAVTMLCLCALATLPAETSARPAAPSRVKADEPPTPEVRPGYYTAEGVYSTGNSYDGVVLINRPAPGVYVVKWFTGDPPALGVGMIDPGGRLVVGWTSAVTLEESGKAGTARGVSSFRVLEGGNKLEGVWLMLPSQGKPGKETLTFLRGLPRESRAGEISRHD